MLLLHLFGQTRSKRNSQFSFAKRLGREFSELRGRLKLRFSFLLFLVSCYIVASRLGPLVSRAGHIAIEAFEVERRIVEEFDDEALKLFREVFGKFRVVTRAPSPFVLFGRLSQDNPLLVTMGNWSSTRSRKYRTQADVKASSESGQVAERKDVAPLQETPPDSGTTVEESGEEVKETSPLQDTQQETAAEKSSQEAEETARESSHEKTLSPSPDSEQGSRASPLPDKRISELRKGSTGSIGGMGSTESLVGLFNQERLNPADYKKPVKFKIVQPTIRTGDLALLYRKEQTLPHLAIFINHAESDPLFPLLLVKGKTKPLPLDKFEPAKPRFIHPITANTRIFYGDYEKVAIQYVRMDDDREISTEEAMGAISEVENIPFSEKERAAIATAETDQQRSLYMSTYMAAYYYKQLGIFKGDPADVTPENFLTQLPLVDPIYVKLPSMKLGPMVNGDPPFLKQLVDGIYPPHNVQPVPYDEAIKGLDTGDLILFSGATSQGAFIKFFDHSQFSHIALVLKAKYTSQLLIWEASTNHAKLVDVQAGTVRTGVEVLPLRNKVFSGWYDRVAIRRLLNLSDEKRQEIYKTMLTLRKEWMGRSYEKDLVQMALSAINPSDTFLSLFQNTHEDLSSLFCSELVAATYQRMDLIKSDRPSNTYTPDDFSSARDSKILCEGVELSEEMYIELKWPTLLKQTSIY